MLKYFDDILGKDLSFSVLFEFLFYFSVRITRDALPLAVLLSSIMTFGNLGENNELVAIKSAGTSLLRTLFPLFIVTILITLFAFYSNNNFVPKANLKALSLLYDIKRKKPSMDLKEGQFYSGIPGYTIKANEKITDELLNKGHKVNQLLELQNSYGPISAIVKTDDSWKAAHDPRVDTASSIID